MVEAILDFLNTLLEAERAGVHALKVILPKAQDQRLKEALQKVLEDEGKNCVDLTAWIKKMGGTPSPKVGEFVEKIKGLEDFQEQLRLLNRGQGWVAREIEKNLDSIQDREARQFLVEMAESHRANIALVEGALGD